MKQFLIVLLVVLMAIAALAACAPAQAPADEAPAAEEPAAEEAPAEEPGIAPVYSKDEISREGDTGEGLGDYAKSLADKPREVLQNRAIPTWLIIVGAIVIFLIGFGLIWKLVPGFVKFIALIVLAAVIAGAAYGIWSIPFLDDVEDFVDDNFRTEQTDSGD